MQIKIERQNRKSIVLKVVDAENAVLKVPMGFSTVKVEQFLNSKRKWIEKTALKLRENKAFSQSLDLKNMLYLNGKLVGEVRNLKSCSKNKIKAFYKEKFIEIEKLSAQISDKIGLSFNNVKMLTSVRVWGSFNSQGLMRLNWKLVILPQRLVEYVVIHELCHGKQMNHSPKFWKLVEKFCPDFKERKKELTKYSFVLKEVF